MLRLDQFHELGILRVVDMRAERDVVDRKLSLDRVAFHANDLARLVEDILIQHKGKKGHEHQLTLTNRRPMPETNRGKGGTERKHVHCFALYIQHGRWGTRQRYLPVLTW